MGWPLVWRVRPFHDNAAATSSAERMNRCTQHAHPFAGLERMPCEAAGSAHSALDEIALRFFSDGAGQRGSARDFGNAARQRCDRRYAWSGASAGAAVPGSLHTH